MKDILKKLLRLFLAIILVYTLVTIILWLTNKNVLNEEWGSILNEIDSEIIINASDKMILNFKFIKMYEYIWSILSIITPYIYLKLGLVEYVERKILGSEIKRIFVRGFLYTITFFLVYNITKLPKLIFIKYIRIYILYGNINISKIDILAELVNYNKLTWIVFFLIAIILYYYYKTSNYWHIIIWGIFTLSNLVGGYYGVEFDKKEIEVKDINLEFIERENFLKNKFDLKDVEVRIIKNDRNRRNINAYMIGYFNNTRVYILESAISDLTLTQYSALIAHEYAHCESDDVIKSILVVSIIDLIGFIIAVKIFRYMKKKRKRGNKEFFTAILILNIIFFILNPIKLAYSRYQEINADNRAMEVLGEGKSNLELQYKLIENTSIPVDVKGIYKWLYYTHPTAIERIENAKLFNK